MTPFLLDHPRRTILKLTPPLNLPLLPRARYSIPHEFLVLPVSSIHVFVLESLMPVRVLCKLRHRRSPE